MQAEEQLEYLSKIVLTIDMNRVYVERSVDLINEKTLSPRGLEKLNILRKAIDANKKA